MGFGSRDGTMGQHRQVGDTVSQRECSKARRVRNYSYGIIRRSSG